MMHGKKDLGTFARAVACLPSDVGVIVAGDPANDGHIVVRAGLERRARFGGVGIVARSVTESEAAAFFTARPVVALPEHATTRSLSAVLLDAIAAGRPCVATLGTATGRTVVQARAGTAVAPADPQALAAALATAARDGRSTDPDATALAELGILPTEAWGRRALELLGLT